MENSREKFGSRLGFILISAGCAIGLGNVWRFPYVVGQYGGAIFVIIYAVFLVAMGIPIMAMEYAVGRASQASVARAFHILDPGRKRYTWFSYPAAAGSYLLMMFYTTVCGWLLYYLFKTATGTFVNKTPEEVTAVFTHMLQSPGIMTVCMVIVTTGCLAVVGIGLQKGVEAVTKVMMLCLFVMIIVLAVKSMTLPGASEGLRFYLVPDLESVREHGLFTVIYEALSQAFFTLSIGIGSMAIFGSYLNRDKRLTGEAVTVTILDTVSALVAGLIIFPICSAFGVSADSGPPLIFITLPNIFNTMTGGLIWGTLFFVFLLFAGIATVIAVFENIVAICQDWFKWSRQKSSLINCVALTLLSMPCIFGYNLWSGFEPLGPGSNILDLEDFILSNNLLPLGSIVFVVFCCYRYGWGWKNFIAEVNAGTGMRFPEHKLWRLYLTYLLPAVIIFIYFMGLYQKFS